MNTETNTIAIPRKVFREIRWYLKHFNDNTKGDEVIRRQSQSGKEIDWKEVYKKSNNKHNKYVVNIYDEFGYKYKTDYNFISLGN